MSIATEDFPVPINPAKQRLASIDVLRGLLMILMAIDHARDFFTAVPGFDPTDPVRSWPALFATRWITHLCAPGFIALAGASVYLQRQRGKSAGQAAKLLLTRGLWLCFLEVTVISYGWSFALAPGLQVIWAIGISMIFLGLLQWLPWRVIGAIGAVIVLTHNHFDYLQSTQLGNWALPWQFLHEPGPIFVHRQLVGMIAYPVVPWIGVICLGYAFGPVTALAAAKRQRISAALGCVFLTVFCLLRAVRGYGDHIRFTHLASPEHSAMSFFEVEKYPPSLHYLLATLGLILLLYAVIDRAATEGWAAKISSVFEVFGRVPFFFYVLHIYIIHAAALVATAALHLDWHFWTRPGSVFMGHLPGWGYNLPGVYLVWFLVVMALYFPCRWFGEVKRRRRDWWLSYL